MQLVSAFVWHGQRPKARNRPFSRPQFEDRWIDSCFLPIEALISRWVRSPFECCVNHLPAIVCPIDWYVLAVIEDVCLMRCVFKNSSDMTGEKSSISDL